MSNTTGKTKKRQTLLDLDGLDTTGTLEALPDATTVETVEDNQVPQPTTTTPAVPEKYKGKTVEDLIRMHEEAEKILGRQGQELGDLRKHADDFIKSQFANAAAGNQPKQQEVDEVDFFRNPEKAITTLIEKHPSVQNARAEAARLSAERNLEKLASKHQDYEQIVSSSEFQDWVRGSRVRSALFIQANNNYDVEAADELFTTWKLLKQPKEDINKELIEEQRKDALKKAAVTSGGGNAPVTTGNAGKKFYRRADIIELIQRYPERYAALQEEIRQAYAENRVR